MRLEGSYADVGGHRIHYLDKGQGLPVMLVHGLAASAGLNWASTGAVTVLSRHFRVIAFDNRGHGRSGKPHDTASYGIETVNDVARLMDHLGIEKAHIAGYSMGGFITLKFAVTHADRVLSFAPCASGWLRDPTDEIRFFERVADALDAGQGIHPLLKRLHPSSSFPTRLQRLFINTLVRTFNDTKALAAMLRASSQLSVEESALAANKLPALAIVGGDDPMRPFAEEMAQVTATMRLEVLTGADHLTTLHRPEFLGRLVRFLRDIPV